VRKDSGDDPDVTNGALIYARVEKTERGVIIEGGEGVGRVTRPGLDQPVGSAAINSTPRRMIEAELEAAAASYGYTGGFKVIISVPNGAETAKKTFNPRIGVEGGISIIGTTGIVEPMSHGAIAETVRIELRQLRRSGTEKLLLTPGSYGEAFARDTLGLDMDCHVCCSNCLGEAIDGAAELGFKEIMLVGHIGKLVKLGIGITNTHSAYGDGRAETLIACALKAGADIALLKGIADCVTADAALTLINDAGLLSETMAGLGGRILATLERRAPPGAGIGFVCFTNAEPLAGILTQGGSSYDTFRGSGTGRA
jgi:cobalt-precorrin-5B (C1)-methyltransferase